MSAVATGTVALVARHMGAGEPEAAERVLQQSLYAVAALAVLLATPVFLEAHAIVELFRVAPAVVEEGEVRRLVRAEVRRLPDREKLVMSLYYDEGLTLAEIGSVLGVTESRVSQIHTKAVLHLRSRLAASGIT